jgi:hypothetical protein
MPKFISDKRRQEVDDFIKEYEFKEKTDHIVKSDNEMDFTNEFLKNARENGDKLAKVLEDAYEKAGRQEKQNNSIDRDKTR